MVSVVPPASQTSWLRPALPIGLVAALLLSLLALASPAPTQASSTYLCTGYSGCAKAGYSHAGYASRNDRMYWRMYAGHNCTNYAAYRMIRAGVSSDRPWSGSGMAYNWGIANADITDQNPTVGSIAWWNRNSGGVGSSGHVAYVEKVIFRREIVISEDSWGGDFAWRTIVKDGRGWPSGFIHFKDKAPPKVVANTAPPTVVGTPQVGVPLSATPGSWSGNPPWFGYQWLRNGVDLPGAIATTYTPTADDRGATISVRITAKRTGYTTGTATSAASAPVGKGGFAVVTPTAVAGTPVVDEVLTVTPGTFSPEPERANVQWRSDGVVIPGANERTLRLEPSLVGTTITVLTIARGQGFAALGSHSPPAGPVLAGAIEVTRPYAVTGRPRVGETLTVVPGDYTPADSAFYYTWLRDGVPFGAHAPTYQLTAADAGHQLSLEVRLAKASHLERIETVRVADVVRTTPSVTAKTRGRSHKAVVKVRVTAPGVPRPPGEVVVRVGGRKLTGVVRDGRARVVVKGLRAGKQRVKVRFTGTDVVERGVVTGKVWVKR